MLRRLFKSLIGRAAAGVRPCVPEGMRIYAVGDIHGRSDLLDKMQMNMLEDASDAADKKIVQIFLGDYVDRGHDSKGVVEWLLKPPPEGWERICLKGNHEVMVLNFLDSPDIFRDWRQYGGLETMHSYGVDLKNLRGEDAPEVLHGSFSKRFPEAHRAFFHDLPLSVEFGDYFFAHAGVRPGLKLENQLEEDLLWIRDEFLFSQMDFGKVVVHGHSAIEKPELLPNRINIDSGAYITGKLSCLMLDGEEQRIL